MKLKVRNTAQGLVPLFDEDFEQKLKLRIGSEYQVTIRKIRNIDFHRKYFALIHCAWQYLDPKLMRFFGNDMNTFRKTVELQAGNSRRVYSIARREWVEQPQSISFESLDENQFMDHYERVKQVLFTHFLTHVSDEDFNEKLGDF